MRGPRSQLHRQLQHVRDFVTKVGAGRLVTKIDDLVKSEGKLSRELAKALVLHYDVICRRPSSDGADE